MTEYTWSQATGSDVPDIVKLAQQHFESEIDNIFTPDPVAYSRNITFAIVNQFYLPTTELVCVCRDAAGKLIAYTWARGSERAAWSDDNMISVRMAHVDLQQSSRQRIRLITEMMNLWEQFAKYSGTSIICSTTMRGDQTAFLRLHARNGYDVRGSFAYKKIDTTQATPANPLMP
jgi:hypothetical protein